MPPAISLYQLYTVLLDYGIRKTRRKKIRRRKIRRGRFVAWIIRGKKIRRKKIRRMEDSSRNIRRMVVANEMRKKCKVLIEM